MEICERMRLVCCSCWPCLLLSVVLVSPFSFSPLGVCRYPKASVPQALGKACCMWYVSAIWWSLTPEDECSCVVWSYVRQSRLVI